ncbi:hypothetical protein BDM02DRAFT_3190570 [Thelephora ganbajun]|uniref:Uncharacterized protein n=1 Tax=Thelephora ganbajun TaxID=370292 RepID=A0ACB6Z4L4_THEGA|nr:hypothetical protein BDM02DRAFT_3190570 [Thelephora ganbajun]
MSQQSPITGHSGRGVDWLSLNPTRRNLSKQGKTLEAERLKARKAKLNVFPQGQQAQERRLHRRWPQGPTTGSDLAPPPSFSAGAPRRMNKEEHRFDAAETLRDFKPCATKVNGSVHIAKPSLHQCYQ